jgi:hypothetical protein
MPSRITASLDSQRTSTPPSATIFDRPAPPFSTAVNNPLILFFRLAERLVPLSFGILSSRCIPLNEAVGAFRGIGSLGIDVNPPEFLSFKVVTYREDT